MKLIGNYRIYNRPIWGIFYKETFNDIKYEFADWCKQNIADSIHDEESKYKRTVLGVSIRNPKPLSSRDGMPERRGRVRPSPRVDISKGYIHREKQQYKKGDRSLPEIN